MPTYSSDVLPSATGIKLGSASLRFDSFLQNVDISGTFSLAGLLSISNLEGIRFADGFTGVNPAAQINAALADAASLLVVVPVTMGPGNASSIPPGKAVLDLRAGFPKLFTNQSATTPSWYVNDAGVGFGIAWSSSSANPASAGQLRLGSGDTLKFRNNASLADVLGLSKDTSDIVQIGDTAGAKTAGAFTVAGALAISGALSGATTGAFAGQVTSSLATGTAPFSIASATLVPTLNVQVINGVTVTGVPAVGNTLTATSASAAGWSGTSATSVILDKQDVLAASTGDSSDKAFYTYSMPSGTLAAGKGIRITAHLKHTSGSASVTYKVWFGATSAGFPSTTNVNGQQWIWLVFNNTGSTTAQWMGASQIGPSGAGAAIASPAENTNSGAPIVIKVTFNVANTDQVTPQGWLVEAIN